MEVITLVLLLSSVAARNIPVHMDQPSDLPIIFDSQPSYENISMSSEFPSGESAESVYVANLGLHVNKNNEDDEKVEDHVNNVVSLENNIIGDIDTHEAASYEENKMSSNKQEEETASVVWPVEAIDEQKNQKTEEVFLEDRTVFKAGCPSGTVRFGHLCKEKM